MGLIQAHGMVIPGSPVPAQSPQKSVNNDHQISQPRGVMECLLFPYPANQIFPLFSISLPRGFMCSTRPASWPLDCGRHSPQ